MFIFIQERPNKKKHSTSIIKSKWLRCSSSKWTFHCHNHKNEFHVSHEIEFRHEHSSFYRGHSSPKNTSSFQKNLINDIHNFYLNKKFENCSLHELIVYFQSTVWTTYWVLWNFVWRKNFDVTFEIKNELLTVML